MNRSMVSLTLIAILVVFAARDASSQDDAAAAYRKAAAPGEPHKKLQSMAGNWDLVVKIPMGPDGKPSEVKGTVAYKSILGGRFIQEEAKTELFGQPFEWVGMYGYDNTKKKFVAVWADNLNTIIEHGDGEADAAQKAVTFIGETVHPGGGAEKFQWVVTFPVDGKLTIGMFAVNKDGSQGAKMMEISGTKAK
jgi:Protein of unknown function (DUF1579)